MVLKDRTVKLEGYGEVLVVAFLALAYCFVFWYASKRYQLSTSVRKFVRRFAPAFLIITPPLLTYGIVCGFLSLRFGTLCDAFFIEKITNREAFYLPIFKGIEYVSGIVMGVFWMRTVKWLQLGSWWSFFILASHGLFAGYRETRSDFGGREMGPTISDSFMI